MTNRLVVSVLVLSLLGACANRPGLRLDLGQGRSIDYVPRAPSRSVVVGADAFEEALSAWVLEIPLSLRSERQPWLVRAAYPGSTPDASWRSLMRLEASRELKRATETATSARELDQAGQHFANRIGPEVARVFVLAVTVVVSQGMTGGAASLASRLSRMPGYPEASVVGATRVGIELAHVGQVSAVAIAGDTIVVSLPATVVAMVARNGAGANSNPGGPRSWRSFSGLKRALGSAEDGKQWHHIVEQTPGNVDRFGSEAIHNTENVIQLEQGLHKRLSGFYSSIQQEITGSRILTVRQWLSTQSLEAQRDFGLQAIDKVQKRIWGVWK
ncbi:hypothetical protein D7Y27_09360 [Corallococcus sp. AB004]|nr:hypothetical protein D7Y27_09360 [Corallococcus sp. AB004]